MDDDFETILSKEAQSRLVYSEWVNAEKAYVDPMGIRRVAGKPVSSKKAPHVDQDATDRARATEEFERMTRGIQMTDAQREHALDQYISSGRVPEYRRDPFGKIRDREGRLVVFQDEDDEEFPQRSVTDVAEPVPIDTEAEYDPMDSDE